MCDFSLHHVNSRPAKVGDRLTTHDFRTGTRGFAASEDSSMAVCLLPGTELSFAADVSFSRGSPFSWRNRVIHHRTAIFRQINKSTAAAHHDALEFPDGDSYAKASRPLFFSYRRSRKPRLSLRPSGGLPT
jgi:hypothetical protein